MDRIILNYFCFSSPELIGLVSYEGLNFLDPDYSLAVFSFFLFPFNSFISSSSYSYSCTSPSPSSSASSSTNSTCYVSSSSSSSTSSSISVCLFSASQSPVSSYASPSAQFYSSQFCQLISSALVNYLSIASST